MEEDLSLKDIILLILCMLILFGLLFGNYQLALIFCNYMKVEPDLALIVTSPGLGVDITVIITIFEICIIYKIYSILKNKFKSIKFCC